MIPQLRLAMENDCRTLWEWRNAPDVRAASLSTQPIPFEDHQRWFEIALADPNCAIYVAEVSGVPVGTVRLNRKAGATSVSVSVSANSRGKGYARAALIEATARCPWPETVFEATIKPDNTASLRLFSSAGFAQISTGPEVLVRRVVSAFQRLEDLDPPTDEAVVVLANHMDANGALNRDTQLRVETAVEVWRTNPNLAFVTSGWAYAAAPHRTIARAMASRAEALGVDAARIVQSPRSRDTVGDAVFFAADVCAGHVPGRVTVVTSKYHAMRAEEIFTFVLGPGVDLNVTASNYEAAAATPDSETASLAAFRSTFQGIQPGDLGTIEQRLFDAHPFYNGQVYALDAAGVSPERAPPEAT